MGNRMPIRDWVFTDLLSNILEKEIILILLSLILGESEFISQIRWRLDNYWPL